MARLLFTCKLADPKKAEKDILDAFMKELEKKFKLQIPNLVTNTKNIVEQNIVNSPEWKSLVSGRERGGLKSELGIPDSIDLGALLSALKQSIRLENRPIRLINGRVTGGIRLVGLDTNFSELLNLPEAKFVTEKGVTIPWLYWLLFKGNEIIVRDFDVSYKAPKYSRTGTAIMIKRKNGVGWRVPPEFSGVKEDNFITRAIEKSLPIIQSQVEQIFKR